MNIIRGFRRPVGWNTLYLGPVYSQREDLYSGTGITNQVVVQEHTRCTCQDVIQEHTRSTRDVGRLVVLESCGDTWCYLRESDGRFAAVEVPWSTCHGRQLSSPCPISKPSNYTLYNIQYTLYIIQHILNIIYYTLYINHHMLKTDLLNVTNITNSVGVKFVELT